MNAKHMLVGGCLVSALLAHGTLLDGGWRISVGAAYNAPAKAQLNFAPARFNGGDIVVPAIATMSKAEATEAVRGQPLLTGAKGRVSEARRFDYDGTGEHVSYYNGTDSHNPDGSPEDGSWNVMVYKGETSVDGDHFVLAQAEYGEMKPLQGGRGNLSLRMEDEAATPGVNVELSRNLYHNQEYHFGLDLAFGVNWFFGKDLFRAGSSYASDGAVYKSGKMMTTISPVSGKMDRDEWEKNPDYYGTGSYDVAGPVFSPYSEPIDVPNKDVVYQNVGSISARGDYWDLEMMLTLRPYYDLLEWLRLYGTIGVAVSRAEFDLTVDSVRNGVSQRYEREYSAWDVYGIGGLGLMFRYSDFCLGCDFLARFLDDDLDIDDRYVHGSVSRGHWMLRACLGYEF